jgi:orotidine-5'-phosphate decarboxylase
LAEVIIPLDFDTQDQALEMVQRLGSRARFYKVGLELFTRAGPVVVHDLVAGGKRVFLDLKLHDIPNTVAGAVRAAVDAGASLLTVHATGGPAMLQAAAEAADGRLEVVAVTILTSLSAEDLGAIFGLDQGDPAREAGRLASLAQASGVDGVVCSAHEAASIRAAAGTDFTIVTPGIRMAGGAVHDQARVMTPAAAVRAGSDYLVIGRPITQATEPAAALDQVLAEVEEAGPAVAAS